MSDSQLEAWTLAIAVFLAVFVGAGLAMMDAPW